MQPVSNYRPGVGIVLVNQHGKVFAGHRRDGRQPPWQLPQGGLDQGEGPEEAVFRELAEELGTRKGLIVHTLSEWLSYDYPSELASKRARKFRGQQHKWFLVRFTGHDHDIDLCTDHPEFSQWRWMHLHEVVEEVAPFKRDVYRQVMTHFGPIIHRLSTNHSSSATLSEIGQLRWNEGV